MKAGKGIISVYGHINTQRRQNSKYFLSCTIEENTRFKGLIMYDVPRTKAWGKIVWLYSASEQFPLGETRQSSYLRKNSLKQNPPISMYVVSNSLFKILLISISHTRVATWFFIFNMSDYGLNF